MSTAQFKVGEAYKAANGTMVRIINAYPDGFVGAFDEGMNELRLKYNDRGVPSGIGWAEYSIEDTLRMLGKLPADIASEQHREMVERLKKRGPSDIIEIDRPDVPDLTISRLDALEARARDTDRQLRTVRGNHSELLADMAAKLGELVDRLDGTDRRVAAINEGLKDTGDLLLKHEDKIATIDLRPIHSRINRYVERMTAIEASLARIEDMLTAEKLTLRNLNTGECIAPGYPDVRQPPARPARKSLGWINVYTPGIMDAPANSCFTAIHPTRQVADEGASSHRIACIEIFEGDGL